MSAPKRLLLAAAILAATPAFAGVNLTYYTNGSPVPVTWASFPITYSVERRLATSLGGSTEVVDKAFAEWTAIADTSVSFRSAGIANTVTAGQNGINTISLTDDLFIGQKFIALTTNWYDENAHVKESDIQLDAGVVSGSYNVQQVIEHEVGHMLGLDHSAVLSSMMYPYVGLGGIAAIDSDDRIMIRTLYPKAQPLGGAMVEGKVYGDGGGVFAAQVVAVNEDGEPVAVALTDQSGRFEMRSVPSGTYRFYAEPLDGPMDVRNLSGNWRNAKVTSFPTHFADGGSIRIEAGRVYGNLVVNVAGAIQLNPKWVGAFDPVKNDINLGSTTAVLTGGQTVGIAVAGDGFTSGMTTFEISNDAVKRVSGFTYAGNYVYATFQVADKAPPGSLVIYVKSGNDSAALTGAVRIAKKKGAPPTKFRS